MTLRKHASAGAFLALTASMVACSPNGEGTVEPLDVQLAAWETSVGQIDGVVEATSNGPAGASVESASITVVYAEGTVPDTDDTDALIAAVVKSTGPDFHDWTISISPAIEDPKDTLGMSLFDLTDLVSDPGYLLGSKFTITIHGDGSPLVDSTDAE